MQAGIARYGRTAMAIFVAIAMMLAIVFLVAGPASADGNGSPAACQTPYGGTGTGDVMSFTAPTGFIVTGVCIKSGVQQFDNEMHSDVLANGIFDNGCYMVSGVGSDKVTVEKVGNCQDLSHIDVLIGPGGSTTSSMGGSSSSSMGSSTSTSYASSSSSSMGSATSSSYASSTSSSMDSSTSTSEEETTTTEVEGTTITTDDSTTTTEVGGSSITTDKTSTTANVRGSTVTTGDTVMGTSIVADSSTIAATDLPFTGADLDLLALLAVGLGLLGALALAATRHTED
jgi:hypothetical protein